VNEVKDKRALAISRDLGLAYKSDFVLLQQFREAMAGELNGRMTGGEGKIAEADGGYVKPANLRENRLDRRLAANQCVVIIRGFRRILAPAYKINSVKSNIELRSLRQKPAGKIELST
jgi:hypothetical protein